MTWIDKIFAGCAVLGGVLFVIRLVLFFIGGGEVEAEADVGDIGDLGDIGDVGDVDVGDIDDLEGMGDTDVSFRLLSFQGITAFFMMIGLVGLALHLETETAEYWAVAGAFAAGMVSLFIIAYLFSLMKRLQSSGTLSLGNAIGQVGSVYLTIPADGTGKIQVPVQGSLKVFEAVTEGGGEIRTGERIRVVNVVSGNIMVVEALAAHSGEE